VPEEIGAALSPDGHRLERILAPWAADPRGPAVWIVDPAGAPIAGRAVEADGEGSDGRIQADVVVDGELVARILAGGGAVAGTGLQPAIDALAVAVGELLAEIQARKAAERALLAHRSEVAATMLGTDSAELAKGRRQQRSIVSLVPPDVPGYDLASHYAAAREIGGDFFELFRLPRRGRPLGIVIADVTGKGLDAALLMAFSRPVMHTALSAARGPADAIERTNRVLVEERRGTLFVTALCAVLQPGTARVRIASAGHEPPLLVPGDGGPIRPVGDVGVLMGAFASLGLPEAEITLAPGDILLFYTDGVTDAVAPSGERFGDERLGTAIAAARAGSAHELVAAIRDRVQAFQGPAEPADDLTLVAVGRHPGRGRRRAGPSATSAPPGPR
jgi:sigma-B regulation protein RsbU (phosphoserine phosphatase)